MKQNRSNISYEVYIKKETNRALKSMLEDFTFFLKINQLSKKTV